MKLFVAFFFATVAATLSSNMIAAEASPKDRLYEMRVYYAPKGKLDDLHARFRNHTLRLFEKHGMKNLAYFVPDGANPEHKLLYFLSYPDKAARDRAWKAFFADPEWQQAAKKSEENGKLVAKVESIFLETTDYSPIPKIEAKGGRIFELRTYTTPEGKLDALNARFRNHTVKLFSKHGMENVIYWTKTPDQPNAKTTLIYLLAHKDIEAGKKSFDSFRQDPDWIKAKSESERTGSLTVPNGVKSEILIPMDYSPLK